MRKPLRLDPRTRLLVLILSSFLAFTALSSGLWITLGLMIVYLSVQGLVRQAVRFSIAFAILFGLQLLFSAYAPGMRLVFGFMFYYLMRFIPVMMAAAALGTASPGELIAALQKIRLPKTVIIPLAVGLRYMPGLSREYQAIQEAARLRGVSLTLFGLLKTPRLTLECTLVPLLMRSLKIADELAASAATRGIEYPGARTTLRQVRFRVVDGMVGALALVSSVAIWRVLS